MNGDILVTSCPQSRMIPARWESSYPANVHSQGKGEARKDIQPTVTGQAGKGKNWLTFAWYKPKHDSAIVLTQRRSAGAPSLDCLLRLAQSKHDISPIQKRSTQRKQATTVDFAYSTCVYIHVPFLFGSNELWPSHRF
jgi:hypothetical protein